MSINNKVRLTPLIELNSNYLEGVMLVSPTPISPLGDIDPRTSEIIDPQSPLYGVSIASKILVAPYFRGSTVGPYILFSLKKYGVAPKLIIVEQVDPMLVTGCVISNIPLYQINSIERLRNLSNKLVRVYRNGRIEQV